MRGGDVGRSRGEVSSSHLHLLSSLFFRELAELRVDCRRPVATSQVLETVAAADCDSLDSYGAGALVDDFGVASGYGSSELDVCLLEAEETVGFEIELSTHARVTSASTTLQLLLSDVGLTAVSVGALEISSGASQCVNASVDVASSGLRVCCVECSLR